MAWKNIGVRSYSRRTLEAQAFVFGAYRPPCLWAWGVYWHGGTKSGVENGFRTAKTKAELCMLIEGKMDEVASTPTPEDK